MPPEQLNQPSKEVLDLDTATILKRPRDLTKHVLDRGAMQAYQKGELQVDNPNPSISHLERIQGTQSETVGQAFNVEPAPQFQPGQPQPVPVYQPPPVAQPTQVPAAGDPPLPSNKTVEQAPVLPTDSQRVQDRIGRLYGQMRSAQEERDVYADRIAQLEARLGQLQQAQSEPTYTLEGAPSVASQPVAGDYVSRQELNAMFGQLTQAIERRDHLSTSQNSSRATVERDFAQELASDDFRRTYETILTSDRSLASDPNGPEKAAIMARGLLAGTAPSHQSSADIARRQALSPGLGSTVPEGSSAPASDQASRYHQAMARAAASGRDEDFVQALLIQRGQA